jgi:hypothetical protein
MDLGRLDLSRMVVLTTVGLFGTTVTAVGAIGLSGWGLATLFAVAPAIRTLTPLLPWFVAGLVLGVPLAFVGFGGVALAAVRGTISARDRLHRRAGHIATEYDDELALLGLDDYVDRLDDRSPDARAEDRVERLKEAYVAGEIDDREFERRVEELVGDADVDPDRVLSLRERVRETDRGTAVDRH